MWEDGEEIFLPTPPTLPTLPTPPTLPTLHSPMYNGQRILLNAGDRS
ncbi:hypothetical protein H6G80_00525 [Nostoc sp. FACHB-87]|nr:MULTISPECIES: hypothetical protein [Nostocaceae]MBD2452587.1 hypothetical protein [Nostoc sp. FACHB-87]MBD2473518.1 hypothetical protein [Anabaena sp. FACHB-83]